MTKSRLALVSALCGLTLAGCSGGEPKGQVVAKVDKEEITVLDLQTELGGARFPDAKARKAAEQQALNAILQRKILAKAAREQKIDKSPDFSRQEERLKEVLLVRTWQERLTKAVPAPNADEIRTFINQHPDLYSARKKFLIDGVRFPLQRDPTFVEGLRPLNTLDEVRAFLTTRRIPFQSAGGEVDAFAVDPRLVDQLVKLPAGEVFVVPQGQLLQAGTIRETKIEPVSDALAVQHAKQYLQNTRTQETISRQFGSTVAAGMKAVEYNKAYEPPKAPAAKPGPKAAEKTK